MNVAELEPRFRMMFTLFQAIRNDPEWEEETALLMHEMLHLAAGRCPYEHTDGEAPPELPITVTH